MILSNNFLNVNLKQEAWNIDTLFVGRPYMSFLIAVHFFFCDKYKEDHYKITN